MNTGYCISCGENFQDGDAVREDEKDGSIHVECQHTEEAYEATWQDMEEDIR